MKLTTMSLLVWVLIACIACSKNKQDPAPTFADQLKGTIWTGEMQYNSRTIKEPYSIYFDGEGNMEWNELDGTFTGTYKTENHKRTVQISFSSGSTITFTVTADNKLTNFQYGGVYTWALTTGSLYTTKEVPLTGTWTGTGSSSFIFISPTLMQQTGALQPYLYTRRHGTIRFGYVPQYHFFGIVTDASIKGIYAAGTSYFAFQVNNF
jgi:hypothetical protein